MSDFKWLVIGMLGLAFILCQTVALLEIFRPEGYNTNAFYTVISIIAPIMAIMGNAVRSHFAVKSMKEEVKTLADKVEQTGT